MRRGHGSTKVPNVKLRPAPQTRPKHSKKSTTSQSAPVSDDADDVYMDLQSCPRPFKGVVICATGVEEKMTLFQRARELGAHTMPDFTDRVTHLIACSAGSAKYNCAVERRTPIMSPSWVTESYQTWLKGDDVDLEESIRTHRLPTFVDVVVSITGVEDLERRTEINKAVNTNGGSYVKEMQRPVKVTHLLCGSSEESEKVQYARKFNKKGEANVQIVWEQWFWDSLKHGGQFPINDYQISRPRPKPKQLASTHLDTTIPPTSSAESAPSGTPQERAPLPHSIPIANLLAPDEPDEPVALKRVPAETLLMWESLLKPRGFAVVDGKLKRSPGKSTTASAVMGSSSLPPSSPSSSSKVISSAASGSGLSSFKRVNSFAPKDGLLSDKERTRQPFRRVASVAGNACENSMGPPGLSRDATTSFMGAAVVPPKARAALQSVGEEDIPKIFSGYRFRALGEANSAAVRSTVESRGGAIVPELDEDVDVILVRLVSGSKYFREETDETERLKYRTECWLEACAYRDETCKPSEHITFTPLGVKTPIPGAERVHISLSGLKEDELCWMQRFVRAVGIDLLPGFSKYATHLFCPSAVGAKFERAVEWKIPVVNMGWLMEMADMGVIPPATNHLVAAAAVSAKGKGKNRDTQMIDITDKTNNSQSDESAPGANKSKDDSNPSSSDGLAGRSMNVVQRAATIPASDNDSSLPSGSFGQASLLTSSLPTAGPTTGSLDESAVPKMSRQDLIRDMTQTRIPSSESPSPLKGPPNARYPSSENGVTKVPSLEESSKILQDKFSSLLGKRSSEEQDEGPTKGRGSKRLRPGPRSNRSRQNTAKSPKSSLPPTTYVSETFSPFDATVIVPDGDADDDRGADDSIRIMYEDPAQQEEKRRLMELVGQGTKEETPEKEKPKRGPARRTTRNPGF